MLKPESILAIPEETKKVAQKAFPKGSISSTLKDQLGPIFRDDLYADWYPSLGPPAESPARLALVTLRQYAVGSIGSICWGWSSVIQALIIPS